MTLLPAASLSAARRTGILKSSSAAAKRTGLVALPKGTPEAGESREETALREVQEETGLRVAIIDELGSVRYTFTAEGVLHDKQVYHYLMEPVGGSIDDHDSEFDSVEWLPLDSATLGRMTYDTDVDILNRAIRKMAPQSDESHGDDN